MNRPRNSYWLTGKVLDSPAKSGALGDISEHFGRPKTAQKDLNNLEKPDRVRGPKKRRRSDELELDAGASCSERTSVKRALSEMAEALAAVEYDQKRQE